MTTAPTIRKAPKYFRESDYEILYLVAEYRLIRSGMIESVTGRDDLRHRLAALVDQGFLSRDRESPMHQYVYWLGPKGYREVKWKRPDLIEEWEAQIQDKSRNQFAHDETITRAHYALKKIGTIDFWYQGKCDELTLKANVQGFKRGIIPDAFFGITANGQTYVFFLEVTRAKPATDPDLRMSELLVKYLVYNEYAKGDFQKEWEIDNFRVLTTLPTSERMFNTLDKLAEMDGLNTKRFWFATEQDLITNPGGMIFKTPRDHSEKSHSLTSA